MLDIQVLNFCFYFMVNIYVAIQDSSVKIGIKNGWLKYHQFLNYSQQGSKVFFFSREVQKKDIIHKNIPKSFFQSLRRSVPPQ